MQTRDAAAVMARAIRDHGTHWEHSFRANGEREGIPATARPHGSEGDCPRRFPSIRAFAITIRFRP